MRTLNQPGRPLAVSASRCGRLVVVSFILLVAAGGAAFGQVRLWPAPGATDVVPDAPLRLTFPAPPQLGSTGTIEIRDEADNAVVDTIDLAAPVATQTIGGLPNFHYHAVLPAGNEICLYPKNGALKYNRQYSIRIGASLGPEGLGTGAGGAAPDWRFATRARPPAPDAARLVIDATGGGDFCTVQGALDHIPEGSTAPITLYIRRGVYTGIIFFTNRHNLTIIGEDRQGTILQYANNDKFNGNSGGNPFAAAAPPPSEASVRRGGSIYRRGMFLAHHVDHLTIANLTLRNTTPHGGSQAEALILNGTTTAHAILKDVDLESYQDTLQVNGQAYIVNCRIRGDVDFMWGTGPCYFTGCTAVELNSGAYYTQVRNPPTNHGYIFSHCIFDGRTGVTGDYLSRIQSSRFPASEVVLLDCTLGPAVIPVGWQLQNVPGVAKQEIANVHFWESNSRDLAGHPIDASARMPGSRQLSPATDGPVIAQYEDPAFVLGGWDPRREAIFRQKDTASPAR